MHIAIFLDQNPHSLGGAQTSVLLQKKYLERQGHKVTLCAPRIRGGVKNASYILFPSVPITLDGEYVCTLALGQASSFIEQEFKRMAVPVDLVHIQGDLWSTVLGVEYAKKHNLPIVTTMHSNFGVGLEKVMGSYGGRILVRILSSALSRRAGDPGAKTNGDSWKYLQQVASYSNYLVAPSHHFAKLLEQNGVAESIEVIQTGVDDDEIDRLREQATRERPVHQTPHFVWSGRMSKEKRLMEFLEAFKLADVDAVANIYGEGTLKPQAKRFIAHNDLIARVHIHNKVTYAEMLRIFYNADALIQTSIGFETQGMTVFEAISMGTPVIVSDKNIAGELQSGGFWLVDDESTEALARTIREAYDNIRNGSSKRSEIVPGYDFRQSNITGKMVILYQKALKNTVL